MWGLGVSGRLGLVHIQVPSWQREMAAPGEPWLHSLTGFTAEDDLPVVIGEAGGMESGCLSHFVLIRPP